MSTPCLLSYSGQCNLQPTDRYTVTAHCFSLFILRLNAKPYKDVLTALSRGARINKTPLCLPQSPENKEQNQEGGSVRISSTFLENEGLKKKISETKQEQNTKMRLGWKASSLIRIVIAFTS